MALKSVANMDDDELMEKWTQAGEDFEKAKARVKEFSAEFHEREKLRAVREKLAAMNDEERQALAQLIEVEGIPSEEAVHSG
jgi:thermostable 8-oxoguanine DNA glycosylase